MYQMFFTFTLLSALLVTPASAPAQESAVLQQQEQAPAARGRRGSRSATAREQQRLSDDIHLRVFQLSHADAHEATRMIDRLVDGATAHPNARTNSIIVSGSEKMLQHASDIINQIDIEVPASKSGNESVVIPVRHRRADALSQNISMLLSAKSFRIGADKGRSAILLSGSQDMIEKTRAIISTLDTPAATTKLDFAFFRASTEYDETGEPPQIPDDLADVVGEIERFGRIELLGRLFTIAVENENFRISGLVSQEAYAKVEGLVLGAAHDGSIKMMINGELSLQRPASEPDKKGSPERRGRPPEFEVKTTVTTERGHYVVLGAAPNGWEHGQTAILVLHVMP